MFRNLDEHSLSLLRARFPRATTDDASPPSSSSALGVPLFLHQATDVAAMRVMETEAIPISCSPFQNNSVKAFMKTAVGLLADAPGSGKSFTMLAHVATRPVVDTRMRQSQPQHAQFAADGASTSTPESSEEQYYTERTTSLFFDKVHITYMRSSVKMVESNIFLVPRGTLRQWLSYAQDLARIPSEQILAIKTPNVVNSRLLEEVMEGKYRYIFVTDTSYREFRQMARNSNDFTTFQRFIIDEADSIHIPSFSPMRATFTWFVTANYENLNRRACTVFIRKLFADTYDRSFSYYRGIEKELVVRSTDDFVRQSLHLPPMNVRSVLARASSLMTSLREHVSSEVMEAIYACDVASATAKLGCSAATSEDGLISAITERYKHEIEVLNNAMRTAPISSLQTLHQRISETESKIDNIVQRVRQVECCPISLDEIQVKAVTPCCQNAFEFRCLAQALQRSARCPMCKTPTQASDIIVKTRDDGEEEPVLSREQQRQREYRERVPFKNKAEAVRHELGEALRDPNAKVLVFSSYNMDNVIDYTRGIAGGMLREIKGATSVIDKYITDFHNGRLRVLLLNANHFGAGLNLECATHIITLHSMSDDKYQQLVGRAQRPGRTGPLSVINVRYEGEA